MDRDELIRRLMATFLEEVDEHVAALNRDALALEKAPDGPARGEQLKSLFRTAHSLKGAARSVDLKPIEAVCHRLEAILAGVRDGARPLDAGVLELVLATADAIAAARDALRAKRAVDESGKLAALGKRLEGAATPQASVRAESAESAEHAEPTRDRSSREPASPSRGVAASSADSADSASSARTRASSLALPEQAASSLRIASQKLDNLLASSGELLLARRALEMHAADLDGIREAAARGEGGTAVAKRLEKLGGRLAADLKALGRAARTVDAEVRGARMLPFATACEGLERAARDLARGAGKEVSLAVEGGAVELDRSVIERLRDPLLHLVRNAVDHGIEPPAARMAAGKPRGGRVSVSAALHGAEVEVVVADDGAGVDADAVRRHARVRGIDAPAGERDLVRLLFAPGFSTADRVTEVSGRGVGLDVVESEIAAIHGRIDVATERGRGMRVALAVPLTLTLIRAVLVSAGGETYAIPGVSVLRLLRVAPDALISVGGASVLPLGDGGAPVPAASLTAALGMGDAPPRLAEGPAGAR
ncbi:MAG TPA: ATP-binding protein, partial [Planctomycetota bacterium]|nr:ATP-binding protein [Planctomycetota bacterium]